MGFSLAKMFGQKTDADYKGEKPMQSLKQTTEGKTASEELLRRLRGEGVGFRQEALDATISPYAKARRDAYEQNEVPAIASSASARGLGRSTIPVNREAMGRSNVENSIGERIAQLQLANEEQRRAEINQALGGLQNFAGQEAGLQNARANFELGVFGNQQNAKAQAEAQAQGLLNTGIGAATTLGTMGLSLREQGLKAAGKGGYAPSSINYGGLGDGGNDAMVDIAGQQFSHQDLADTIAQMFKK